MYIQPNTMFVIISGVPFNNEYKHTILFENKEQQENYFISKKIRSFTDFTYVKQEKRVRVPVVADKIYQANYCMFKNVGYGDKWFYGFITNIEYINNELSCVDIEIDYMQTWMFEMEIRTSFVEREHVIDDSIGKHTVAENLDVGELVIQRQREHTSDVGILLTIASDDVIDGELINNVYNPLVNIGSHSVGSINDILSQYQDKTERIANLCMISDKMLNEGGELIEFSTSFNVSRFEGEMVYNDGTTYKPKNNKLFVYPYSFFTVDNFNGNVETYYWEDFKNKNTASFGWQGSPIPTPCMECFPLDYKNQTLAVEGNKNTAEQYSLTYDNFPQCPYIIDNYRAWSSQTVPRALMSTGTAITLGALADVASHEKALRVRPSRNNPNPHVPKIGASPTAIIGGLSAVGSVVMEDKIKKLHSTSIGGTIGVSGLNFAYKRVGFRSTVYQMRLEYAKIIDGFFTRYGYKVDSYKEPELKSRETFNYVKTHDCQIAGNIPTQANDVISTVFDNGVTLWHTVDVGNYELTNNIRGD